MFIDVNGNWTIYWGASPLPSGVQSIGVVERNHGDKGALLLLSNGNYVQGNAGAIRSLSQAKTKVALGLSSHGGERVGAGRPNVDELRKLRSFKATDKEWEAIKTKANENGFPSASEFIRAKTLK